MANASKDNHGQLCAILSYLLIGIIWYIIDEKMHKDSFVKFHVKQSVILLIADIIFWVVTMIIRIIPVIGWIISLVLWIFILVLLVIGIINALNNKEEELPVIGHYAKKLTF